MSLQRTNPDIGYLSPEMATSLGFCQMIRAGDFLYIAGVAPVVTAPDGTLQLVSPGVYPDQLRHVLSVIEKTLATEHATLSAIVAVTVYVRNVTDYVGHADILNKAFGANLPTSTMVGVSSLFFEEQRVEISAVAYYPTSER